MVILLVLLRITNFRLFGTIIDEGRQLQFLHLKFPLNRYLIRNGVFLLWLQFLLLFLIIGHFEAPTLYDFDLIFLLRLGIYQVFTIKIKILLSMNSIVICSNRFLFFYFDLLRQVLHLIDFFRLSFSNNYFRHFFCFIL